MASHARALAGWILGIAAFVTALQLIWPTPFAILLWGIAISSLSALLAIGLALVYRSHRVINFAQADLGAVPAGIAVSLVAASGWSYWTAVPFALLVAVVLGSVVEFVVIRRFRRAPRLILMVATIGLAQLLVAIAQAIPPLLGEDFPAQRLPQPFSFHYEIWPFIFHAAELVTVVTTVLAVVALFVFLRFTNVGVAMRAVADRSDRAALLGVNVAITQNLAWILAAVLGTMAMIMRAGMIGLPFGTAFGPSLLLRALAAAVIGRMERFGVIFAAACGIGMLEIAVIWNNSSAALVDPILFVVILVTLLVQRQRAASPEERQLVATWDDAARIAPIPRELARLPELRIARFVLRAVVVAAVVALPFFLGLRDTNLAAAVLIYSIIAISLVVLAGWAGEISLGQVAFVAIGASAAGAANVHWHLGPIGCFLLAAIVGAVTSVVIGIPALRLRGLFLSVTTLAFAVATSSYLLNREYVAFLPNDFVDRVTRGSISTPFGSVSLGSERAFYFVCAAGLGAVVLAMQGLQHSRVRRDIMAGRDNENNALAFGLNPARAKLLAFAISGFFASFAGGLLVLHQQALGEQIFAPIESLRALTMVVVGGLGSVPGAILGAVFVKSTEWFNVIVPREFRRVFTFAGSGIGLLIVLWLLPGGFGSLLNRARDTFLRAVARRRSIDVPSLARLSTDRTAREPTPLSTPALLTASPTATPLAHSQPTPAPRGNEPEPLLTFHDVDIGYGHVQVVSDATFSVREHESLALLGTNGAGKSTVLRAASGLLSPDRGTIRFDGRDITGMSAHRIAARGLAYVPGGRSVFPSLTVAENLRMGSWLRRRDRAAVGAAVERVLTLFPGLRARLHDPANELSGGQQQMLAIAMALQAAPKLLMVDELSLGLAPLVIDQVIEVLGQLQADGLTLVVVEQSVDTAARSADHALFLDDGVIRFRGPTAQLFDRPDLLRSVFLDRSGAGAALPEVASALLDTSPASRAASDRVDASPRVTSAGAVALSIHGVTHRFAGVVALDDVNLELREGEILGLVGPNGAGKTTLLNVVSGFLDADAGRIVSDGVDITAWSPPRRARHGLGRSFQDARLFPSLTVHETISIAVERELSSWDPVRAVFRTPGAARAEREVARRADEVVEMMGIGDYRDKFVSDLSTGSKRIVELACQVAMLPRVLLLDEPSAGIAQRETDALGALLLRVRAATRASFLMIEHNLPLVGAVCDRVIALDLGRVIAEGTPDEALADPSVVAAYIGSGRDPNEFGRLARPH